MVRPGIWYLVPGTWYQVLGTMYLVLGTWYQVPGTWYIPGTSYLVLGTRYLVHLYIYIGEYIYIYIGSLAWSTGINSSLHEDIKPSWSCRRTHNGNRSLLGVPSDPKYVFVRETWVSGTW